MKAKQNGARWAKTLSSIRLRIETLHNVQHGDLPVLPKLPPQDGHEGTRAFTEIVRDWGLQLAPTRPNRNCQYYAIAQCFLRSTFAGEQARPALIKTTQHVKTAMQAAARLHFDDEFPGTTPRMTIHSLQHKPLEETSEGEKTELQLYFKDVAESSPVLAARLPMQQWGAVDTLKMLAKAFGLAREPPRTVRVQTLKQLDAVVMLDSL